MYNFSCLTEGQNKASELDFLIDRYTKYMRPYAKIKRLLYKGESITRPKEKEALLKKEEERIIRLLPNNHSLIVLSEHGTNYTSQEFASLIDKLAAGGAQSLAFVIGSPLGISESLQKQAQAVLFLSPLTFPHDIAEVLLYEQLYRAMTILNSKTYHY